jgi:hypothetical protein
MASNAHSGVAGDGGRKIPAEAEAAGARVEPVVRKTRPKSGKGWEETVTMNDVLSEFSELELYRARLNHIAERMRSVTDAWSLLDLSGTPGTLGMLHELAKNLVAPPGCRAAQDALLYAMRSYHTAMEGLERTKVTDSPSEYEAAWGNVRDGDALLALAIELADEA